MNHYSSGARNAAYALITATFAWLAWPSSGALAQDNSPPAASGSGAAPAAAANPSRRERRRAAEDDPAAAARTTAASAPASAASNAAAPPAATAVPEAAAAAASDGPATICKNIKPLGTRMAKRVCGTPEQWAALEKKTTDAGEENMRQVRGTGGVIATTPGPTATP